MKKFVVVLMVLGLVIGGSGMASATLLVDRGLPTININNAAGANRSNVTWQDVNGINFTGDDFTIGTVGQSYLIENLTVWGAQYNPLSLDIDNIWLYMSKYSDPLALVATGLVTDNTNSNPNITHMYVNYADGTTYYEGNSGVHYQIAQTTFSGLNYLVEGGVKYKFGIDGDKWEWWNHASNAALSGSPQEGADGKFLDFSLTDLSYVFVTDSGTNGGWDKSSDINVRITGVQVPEPATMLLLGFGLVSLAGIRRKFRS
ncbi:MAG: PEP-CTERM sorting domain-containing protein [Syntrophales bacterium]|nr:PEP-CTERM sorting domain-containing protein [Syntrophales bacterium]